jgi:hypothetical protein
MERKIFRGVGAVIAVVETDRRFTVVPRMRFSDPTDFSATRQIPIDLDRTPRRAESWGDVEIDDRGIDVKGDFLGCAMAPSQLTGYHVTSLGGYTGVGAPDDLARGPFIGAVFLEDTVFERNRTKIDLPGERWPTAGLRGYQLTTLTYSNSPENGPFRARRYAGFHGRLKRISASIANVELVDLTGAAIITEDFDLGSPEHCDPNPPLAPGETALRGDSSVGSEGAIFVELGFIARIGGSGPKLPIGLEQG